MKTLSNKKIIISSFITGVIFLLITISVGWFCNLVYTDKASSLLLLQEALLWINITAFIVAMNAGEYARSFSFGALPDLMFLSLLLSVPVVIYCLLGFVFILVARIYKNIRNISLGFFIVIM